MFDFDSNKCCRNAYFLNNNNNNEKGLSKLNAQIRKIQSLPGVIWMSKACFRPLNKLQIGILRWQCVCFCQRLSVHAHT